MALYTEKSADYLRNLSRYTPSVDNAIGRDAGANAADTSSASTSVWDNIGNFFKSRGEDIENAFGTTGAAIASFFKDNAENASTDAMLKRHKESMENVYKSHGFNGSDDYYNQLDAAEANGSLDDFLAKHNDVVEAAKAQAQVNSDEAKKKADDYRDYRENNYISKKINQDNGKFAGSAINTLSTAADLTGLSVGPVGNAIQGAAEGLAEELKAHGGNVDIFTGETSGWDDFSGEQAAKNAVVGAATGAVTGSLNKAINGKMLSNGGNLFKGSNKLTQALNNAGSKTALGRGVSTIATGVGRGAISGAAGGATGAAVSSALNGEDVGTGISNAIQGATNGALTGGAIGGTMAGANLVANKLPGINKVTDLQKQSAKAVDDWQNSGDNFRERLSNTWNSGDSKVANMAQNWQSGGNNFRERLATTMDSFKSSSPAHFTQQNWGLENVPEAEVTTKYAGMSPSQMLNSKAQDAGFDDYETAVRRFTDAGEAAKGTDIVEWMDDLANQRVQSANTAAQPTTALDNWDRLAREGGYENWDTLEQRFMEANPNYKPTGNDAGAVLGWMDNNPGDYNPNARVAVDTETTEIEQPQTQTGKQIRGQRKIVEEITSQFNAPDKPTVRATKPQETFKNLYEDWGLSDGDDIRQAVSYAEPGSLVPKMISEAAGEAGIIDLSDAQGMVLDLGLSKNSNYKKTVAVLSDIWDSMPNEDIVGGKNGVDALKFQRAVEQAASDAQGTSGEYHIGNNIVDQTTAKNLMRIANNIGDKLDEAATSKNAVQNVLTRHSADIQQMKNAFPNNQQWQNKVDTEISGAKTIRDLRHSIRDLTRANIYINNGDENFSTIGGRFSARYNNVPTSKAGVVNRAVNWVVDKVAESPVARNIRLDNYTKQMHGGTTTKAPANTSTATTAAPTTTSNNTIPASMMLYNAIGRDNGEAANEQVKRDVASTPSYSTLESMAAFNPTSTTAIVDSYAPATTAPIATTAAATSSPYVTIAGNNFGNTGNSQLDLIGTAMSMALADGDATAFGQLYKLYNDTAADIASTQAKTKDYSDVTNWNSADRTKLLNAQNGLSQINALANAYEQAGGGQGWLSGTARNLAGKIGNLDTSAQNYNNLRESVGMAIIKNLVNLGVTEADAERYKQYLPSLQDTEEQAQQKLEVLRTIYQDQINNLYSAYGL